MLIIKHEAYLITRSLSERLNRASSLCHALDTSQVSYLRNYAEVVLAGTTAYFEQSHRVNELVNVTSGMLKYSKYTHN